MNPFPEPRLESIRLRQDRALREHIFCAGPATAELVTADVPYLLERLRSAEACIVELQRALVAEVAEGDDS